MAFIVKNIDPSYRMKNGVVWQALSAPIAVWRGPDKDMPTMKEIEQLLNDITMGCKKPKKPKK